MNLAAVNYREHSAPIRKPWADPVPARLIQAAGRGDGEACHALGVVYSTSNGSADDLIEAHKWFNLGAMYGYEEASQCRADIAGEMAAHEIAEAQRRARAWLNGGNLRAA